MRLFAFILKTIEALKRLLHDRCGAIDEDLLEIPQQALDSFARMLLPKLQLFFESDEGKREFEQWRLQQAEMSAK